MNGDLTNIAIIMNEGRRLSDDNNNNSTANNNFILATDMSNNSGKVQLNKLNDFVDYLFLISRSFHEGSME